MTKTKRQAKERFNDIILSNLILDIGYDSFGYPILDNDTINIHTNYYSLAAFNEFTDEMKNVHSETYKSYYKGSGNELLSKGTTPPKMASVASSSLFCYLALRKDTSAFGSTQKAVFEKRCPIKGVKNATANLDAYIEDQNIYIEAKCQEIFDKHETKMRIPYWDCIYGTIDNIGFNLTTTETKPVDTGKNHFEIPMKEMGLEDVKYFDFKQFLCHLLGIASENQKNKITGTYKTLTLCYMFFKPLSSNQDALNEIESIFDNLKNEIKEIFTNNYIQAFCQANNIKLMAIAEEARVMKPLDAKNKYILFP